MYLTSQIQPPTLKRHYSKNLKQILPKICERFLCSHDHPMLRIRIRIHVFLGLLDPDPVRCYHLELMLSSGTKCYHLKLMLWYGASVIIWFYHGMLSSGMITPPFYFSWKLHSLTLFSANTVYGQLSWIAESESLNEPNQIILILRGTKGWADSWKYRADVLSQKHGQL